jgi:hypothetical protein
MSEIFVDTIRKTGGSLGTDIRIKNTSVYESDGGTSVTQNTVQSLVKTWAINDHTSTSVLDSFNQSSITDTSTGILTWDVTNNFSSVNWTASSNLHADNADNAVSMVHSGTRTTNGTATDKDTTGTSWYAKNSSHSGFDSKLAGHIACGDVA